MNALYRPSHSNAITLTTHDVRRANSGLPYHNDVIKAAVLWFIYVAAKNRTSGQYVGLLQWQWMRWPPCSEKQLDVSASAATGLQSGGTWSQRDSTNSVAEEDRIQVSALLTAQFHACSRLIQCFNDADLSAGEVWQSRYASFANCMQQKSESQSCEFLEDSL